MITQKTQAKKDQKQKINSEIKFLCDDEIFDRCVESDNRKSWYNCFNQR